MFVWTRDALEMAFKWSSRKEEFVKRGGFVMMAEAALHLKTLSDHEFIPMLKAIHRESADERDFVRKAVNWALRQIGKRNLRLNKLAIETARGIEALGSSSARWVARDALRELRSSKVQTRLRNKVRRSWPR